ncbi:MAG: hypothetical protein SF029_18765 [bacterium]|nr:hypothetical protein [bacterium]
MGIKLDWEIEAEQNTYKAGEAPEAARARRIARLRLLMLVIVLLAIFGGVAALLNWRLREVQRQQEQLLRDVVDTEITNLRLGNFEDFYELQRSGDVGWMDARRQVFDDYQALLLRSNVQLTGNIKDIVIDDLRARVRVEEIVDGVPYELIWFYFRYPDDGPDDDDNDGKAFNGPDEVDELIDGWRRVPPDYTFWGETETLQAGTVNVSYRQVDKPFARSLADNLAAWFALTCEALTCSPVPSLQVNVVAENGAQLAWADETAWRLTIPSPFLGQARADLPFTPEMQIQAANLVAERLVNEVGRNVIPLPRTDAAYLRGAVVAWLVGRMVQIDAGSYLIDSLATNYGEGAVGQLIRALLPDSSIAILSSITGVSTLDQMPLDWRDFFTWRLNTESELIAVGDSQGFLNLYDVGDPAVYALASARYNANLPAEPMVVSLVSPAEPGANGAPQRSATVQIGAEGSLREETVLFRLIDNVWRRAS